MKKVITTALAATLLTTSAMAGSHSQKRLNLTVGASTLGDSSATEYSMGMEGRKIWDNGLMLATSTTVTLISLDEPVDDEVDLVGLDLDFKVGYVYRAFSVYGFGTMTANSVVYGFGGGVGCEYQPTSWLSIGADYRSVSTETAVGESYDYDSTRGYVTFIF